MNLIIEALTEAAHGAIEQAAADAAKAAVLEMIEREAAALREMGRWKIEAEKIQAEMKMKNSVLIGVLCFVGGLALGVGGTLIISN
jgi:hypothetical protein